MADVTLKVCDHCGETIQAGQRRYRLTGWLVGVNGESKRVDVGDLDLCSAACVQKTVERMIGEVRG